ncbi:MAG: Gfo/Idh/MocA family oxidoreductase [Armatimonadetes bacterium]|nr:Gfo/Idh/MocA family oxidoreductase [Armatimonadota bacterium]
MHSNDKELNHTSTRREFLASATAVAGALAAPTVLTSTAQAANAHATGPLRVGLVGCGGRGTGAAAQALNADPGVILVSMGDVFLPQIDRSLAALRSDAAVAKRVQVKPENRFVGLDCYQKVIDSGVDVVLLASPPGFRPREIRAAVDAGKHLFAEKPCGTDSVGTKSVIESARRAKEKKLSFVAGFCWRYDPARREFYRRIHEGAIGPVRHVHATYLSGPVKPMPPTSERPAGMSDVEWQIRNWYNFVWLSGDGLVEQACHSVDKLLWVMKDVPPARAVASGGRNVPNNEGNIYDHIDVFYEWPDGTRITMAQRQVVAPHYDNSDYLIGTKGDAFIKGVGPVIRSEGQTWRYQGPQKNMYQVEHDELFASIRKGEPINDGERMARSTLTAIMGRMAAYTGEEVTWDQMMKSQENLFPENLNWNQKLPIAPMAVPGKTRFQ